MSVPKDDILKILQTAAALVEEADLPSDLRPNGFTSAVALLISSSDVSSADRSQEPSTEVATDGPIARIAKGLKIDPAHAKDAFDAPADGELWLLIPRSKFPKSKAPAMRQLSLLVAAGRQVGGLEEWTASDVLREQCRQFGVFDRSNFAAELAGMHDLFVMRGKGQQREFRVTRGGVEEARRIIEEATK